MAKPRIFVSSTYYDLKHIRTSLEAFINSFGYEPVLFESGDIFFSHDKPLDESCYKELHNCHMQVLIIGGNYGSPESLVNLSEDDKKDPYKVFNSVTKKEFEVAHSRKIPIYFFVERAVLAEYTTFKKNRTNEKIVYAHVSSVNIFHLLDEIYALKSGNYVQGFTKFEDISEWLKLQWAHLMAEFISDHTKQIELRNLNQNIDHLSVIASSLKEYTEAILNKVEPEKAPEIINSQQIKYLETKFNIFKSSSLHKFVQQYLVRGDVKELYNNFRSSKTVEEFLTKSLPNIDISAVLNDSSKNMLQKSFRETKEEM